MKKKKILFVVEAMGGGVFTYIVDLANKLVKDYDMFIAYAVRSQTPEDYKAYFDDRIHLVEVKNFTRSINPVKDLKAVLEVKKIADEIQPDIIHLHSSKAGVIGRIAFNGKNIPLYYTPHGYSFLMKNYTPLKRMMFKAIETIFAKRNCTTIGCSFGEYIETLNLTKKATYIDNGINTAELEGMIKAVDKEEHPFTVFTLGRICHQKNPQLFNSIAETMPDVRFVWIGDGELRDELKAPNIEITGWVDRENALKRCYNADVFLLTSLWEGLPISLLEAMYMKKLCVVNDTIGNHDVIKNGVNGFVCKTVNDFIKAIRTTDTEKLIKLAYEDIQKRYNIAVMADEYDKIYQGKTQHELVLATVPA
ncbi:glycosyltransferase [Oribacterium sp. P6A1]|uniref:glycosyltransferase n=1 Tax=Oribacterium sp. P6A1 TaxID=1410612 RepID=UPI0005637003|nr:glycosyltransferase [Oribacterium sp. P6A1]